MAELGILDIRPEALPEKEGHDLAIWMARPEGRSLLRVVESRIRESMSEAMKPALASRDYPQKMESSNASLVKAHRYTTFLDVWKELRESSKFTVNKWSNP